MILNILAVKDRAADAFMQPFFAPTEAMAVRSFEEECGKADSVFSKHPTDFDLYWLGSFDDNKGAVTPGEIRMVRRAQDVKRADVVPFSKEN